MENETWPPVAVVGAGAVGCYFGGMPARAGAPVCLIGRPHHVQAIARDCVFIDGIHVQQRIPVSASTDLAEARHAKVVLFCFKTVDTAATARALTPHLAPGAIIVSLQNGVDNAELIGAIAAGADVIPAVVYVATEMTAPGRVRHTGRGDLIIGNLRSRAPDRPVPHNSLTLVAGMFAGAGVPCRVSDNIEADLWMKLIMNCAFNAISALTGARYGRIAKHPLTREIMREAVEEALAVARAAGVQMTDADPVEAAGQLAAAAPGALSSTAQDLSRGKHTEIDSLNGYIARRGEEFGIAVPVNRALQALVKLAEENGGD